MNLPPTPSPQLADFVKGWEDCCLEAWLDTIPDPPVWTCGWGDTGEDVVRGVSWTQAEADMRLAAALREAAVGLRGYLYREPTQQQFDAMVSLAYNCGVPAIGTSGLVARFNSGLIDECAERFLLWDKSNGVVVPGLLKRREAEKRIFTDGDYSGRP